MAKPLCMRCERFLIRKDTQEDPLHISVHYGDWLAKGNAGDGGGSVLSDSGEFAQFFGGPGENALVLLDHHLRGFVHHLRAAVIAQAAPGGKNVWLSRLGESGYGREQG